MDGSSFVKGRLVVMSDCCENIFALLSLRGITCKIIINTGGLHSNVS